MSEVLNELGDVSDVTHSTAFLSVDALLEEGKVVEERAAHLKGKFKDLHDRVLQIYNHDNFLLKRARQARKELEAEKSKVERCGEVARDDDDQIQQLKKELAAAEHELSVAQEKESMLQVEALELDRKRQNLTHEVEDAMEAERARLRPQLEGLQKDIKLANKEVEDTTAEFERIKGERDELLKTEATVKEETKSVEQVLSEAKVEFTRVEREPERAKKQAEIVEKALVAAQKESSALDDRLANQQDLTTKLQKRKMELNTEVCELTATSKSNLSEIAAKEATLQTLQTNLSFEEESRQQALQRLSELQGLLKGAAVAFNNERDQLNRTIQAKEVGLREFKQIDQTRSDLDHEHDMYTKQLSTLVRESRQAVQARKQCSKDLEDLKRDVDILINNFLTEEIAENRCVKDREQTMERVKALEDDIVRRAAQEAAHKREIADLGVRREQTSRDCSKNQARVMLARNEIKVKDVVLKELKKRHDELSNKLTSLMEMFQTVKRERSQKAAQIQSASQRMSEMQEKIKILDNELEVLRRESLVKDQELLKKRRESHELRQTCKNLRVEINKAQDKLATSESTELDLKNRMRKLNTVITTTEDEMLELKKNYEDAVENRNYAGIRLIDRNDELCILYEKANVQETILKQGTTILNQRKEEIRALSVKLADLQRQIELCQRVLPEVRDMEEQLSKTLLELDDERMRAEILEHDITDPSNAARWRLTGKPAKGADGQVIEAHTDEGALANKGPTKEFIAVQKQVQQLEQRVTAVTEKLMEKDLLLEEVTEHSNKLRKQALNGRDFTLALAKRVGAYQAGIKNKTKKMMATLSELSMVQASSLQLRMEVQELEGTVVEAETRLERGEAPTDYHQYQVEKEEYDRARHQETLRLRRERLAASTADPSAAQSQSMDTLTGVTSVALRTTAEQRPNAYIPDGDLALPKPYGAHAPFKPNLAAQTNSSRYFRKSPKKEISFDE